ncbi:hypothetical protein C8J55DRAFT_566035 [Lentinula edodes]|uniref:Uncharacterized protein n=1 Tax=Lentinula lateritia TaxID=40482 RepID=A0A9W9DEX9_9AGAR|nr:hypothetical protein C8J55DRAFT_566035 [Lentinula edodes]
MTTSGPRPLRLASSAESPTITPPTPLTPRSAGLASSKRNSSFRLNSRRQSSISYNPRSRDDPLSSALFSPRHAAPVLTPDSPRLKGLNPEANEAHIVEQTLLHPQSSAHETELLQCLYSYFLVDLYLMAHNTNGERRLPSSTSPSPDSIPITNATHLPSASIYSAASLSYLDSLSTQAQGAGSAAMLEALGGMKEIRDSVQQGVGRFLGAVAGTPPLIVDPSRIRRHRVHHQHPLMPRLARDSPSLHKAHSVTLYRLLSQKRTVLERPQRELYIEEGTYVRDANLARSRLNRLLKHWNFCLCGIESKSEKRMSLPARTLSSGSGADSWMGSMVGKRWEDTISKNQKRASVLLSDVSQSISQSFPQSIIQALVSPPLSASSELAPPSGYHNGIKKQASLASASSTSLLDEDIPPEESGGSLTPLLEPSPAPFPVLSPTKLAPSSSEPQPKSPMKNKSINSPSGYSWLQHVSAPVLIRPTSKTSDLLHFAQDSWRNGRITERSTIDVRGGELATPSWKSRLHRQLSDVETALSIKIPDLPGFPHPKRNAPIPPLADLITLRSFQLSSAEEKLAIQAVATMVDPAPINFNVTVPKLPFVVSLLSESSSLTPIASVQTDPFALTHPNITLGITGYVLSLPPDAFPVLSTFLTHYLAGRSNLISISTPLVSDMTIEANFPAPNPKPQILRNVTIHDMKMKPGNTFLASGTVLAHIVLPKGMDVDIDIDVKCVLPDVLVFDGEVPDDVHIGTPPVQPLPNPLPEGALGHIRPDEGI